MNSPALFARRRFDVVIDVRDVAFKPHAGRKIARPSLFLVTSSG